MRKSSIARKRLTREIASQMGTKGRRSLRESSHPEIQEIFHPHSKLGPVAGYPKYQIFHELAKLPQEHIGNFVDLNHLRSTLRSQPAIASLLKAHPSLNASFEASVQRAVRERGIKGSKYWETAPKEYIDKIIAGGKANPNVMNQRMGDVCRRHFGEEVKPRTILDIGTFSGGTISGVVSGLKPEQRRLLNVVLVDVAGKIVKEHAVPELVKLGVPRKNIRVIPSSFYNAAVAFRQMPRPLHEKGQRKYAEIFKALSGKVDFISAGASTINFANDLRPFMASVKSLLKKGGVYADWEWGSAEARTPTVNVPELKKKVIGPNNLTEHDSYVSFLNFWMGFFNYPAYVKDKLFSDIERSKEFNFFRWVEANEKWMEQERRNSGAGLLDDPAGFRNRAYRTPDSMLQAAQKAGFTQTTAEHPIAKPGIRDTGNVNWFVTLQK